MGAVPGSLLRNLSQAIKKGYTYLKNKNITKTNIYIYICIYIYVYIYIFLYIDISCVYSGVWYPAPPPPPKEHVCVLEFLERLSHSLAEAPSFPALCSTLHALDSNS